MNYISNLLPSMLEGLTVTLQIFLLTLLFSIPLGILIAMCRVSKIKIIKNISEFYIWVMRGTPLLLQLVVLFFGLPTIGITLNRFTAALIAFSLNYGAYFGEIFRTGLENIDIGQYEACEILGFSRLHTFKKVVLPQMFKKILPALTNEIITLVKDTSLVYIVGLGELLRSGKIASNRDASLIPLFLVGFIYLMLIAILSKLFSSIEKDLNYY